MLELKCAESAITAKKGCPMLPILFLSPMQSMADHAQEVARQMGIDIHVKVAGDAEALDAVRAYPGIEVVVSRGGLAEIVQQLPDLSVVEIAMSPNELLANMSALTAQGIRRIGIVSRANLFMGAVGDFHIQDVEVRFRPQSDEEGIRSTVKKFVAEGVEAIIGCRVAFETARERGITAIFLQSGPVSIRKALEALADYMHLHSDGLRLTIEEDEGLVTVGLAVDSGRPVPIRQGVELALGFIHRSLHQLLGRSWRPRAISFTHAAPARRDAHRRFFGTNVEFGQDCNAIVCFARDLDAAVPTSDPAIARQIQRYLDAVAPRRNATMRDNARECIYLTLPSGLCSADRVAQHLGVDRRTLHRHLAREGETFSSLLDAVRVELATRYIGDRDRPLASVAELLGFSALSAFSRWFRSRFGYSVSQWRHSASGAAMPPTRLSSRSPAPTASPPRRR